MSKTNEAAEAKKAEEWLDGLDPDAAPARDARYLRAVGEALDELEEAEARLHRAVLDARNAGESWAMIGMVLGTARQNVQRKYATWLARLVDAEGKEIDRIQVPKGAEEHVQDGVVYRYTGGAHDVGRQPSVHTYRAHA